VKKLLSILPFLLLALACSTFPWSNSASSTSQPAIVAFTATPSAITAGQMATLMWNVTNATSVQIDQGVGSGLGVAGTITVAPAATTNYILTATNSAGSITNSVTVTVSSSSSSPSTSTPSTIPSTTPSPALRPNILVFDISPNTINVPPGTGPHQATMRWEVRNAAAVYINGSPVALNGSQILTRGLGTHTYVLRAINAAGEETRTQVLHVNP
jgi:hypothetical protein